MSHARSSIMPQLQIAWTPEMDAYLVARWYSTYPTQLGREMGLKGEQVRGRGKRLGLIRHPKIALNQPPDHEWFAIASQMALEAKIRPAAVLGWDMSRKACAARWKAWAAILQSGQYTIAGVARTSGVHHTSILNALKRMEKAKSVAVGIARVPDRA